MDAADHTIRQLVTVFWVFADAPVGAQVIIHILDIRRSDFGDLLLAKSWLDVEIDISAVPVSSAGPDDACHNTVQPVVQPLTQREFAVLRQIYEYSRLLEPPVRRLRATVPAARSQVSVAESH